MNIVLGDRIKELRKKKNLTMKQLGEKLNLAESTISLYESNKREPDSITIAKLAKLFDVSVDYLLGVDEFINEFGEEQFNRQTKIAVLGTIRAGIPASAIEDILDYEEITEDMARHGKHFALKIKGNSMFPNLIEGENRIITFLTTYCIILVLYYTYMLYYTSLILYYICFLCQKCAKIK